MFLILLCLLHSSGASNDPEIKLKGPELIAFYKYPIEIHKVTTKDGYILELHRIPVGRDERAALYTQNTRPIILMMHGLWSDSMSYLMNPPPSSPAYVFADAGFDVWLANCRGNWYSQDHVKLSPKDKAFWNFTWYDHAHRDLPDSVDYILERTGQQSLYYMGHSQGTTVMFTKLAEDEEGFHKKIRQFYALGPVGGLKHVNNILNVFGIGPIYRLCDMILSSYGNLPLMIPRKILHVGEEICSLPFIGSSICLLLDEFFDGRDFSVQVNKTRIGFYLEHFPTATSVMNLLFWIQTLHHHKLRRFDFGKTKNVEVYGQEQPPEFNLSRIVTPTFMYFSDDDQLASTESLKEMAIKSYGPGLRKAYDLNHFTHLDFLIGLRATHEIYRPIINNIYADLKERSQGSLSLTTYSQLTLLPNFFISIILVLFVQ